MEKLEGKLLAAFLLLSLLGSFILASALQTDTKVINSFGSISYDPPPPPPPPGPNDPPVAVTGKHPTSGTVNGYFTLSSDLSYDPDGYIASYHWNFGNGATSTSANPRYAYPSTGTYTITLTVTDDDGATDSDSATVQVYSQPPPKHAFSITSTPITSIAFTINGMVYSTPYSGAEMAEGYYNVTAPRYVETGGIYYEFVGWSEGSSEVSRLVYLDKDTGLEMRYQDTSEPPSPPGPNQSPVASASVSPSGGTVGTVFGFSSAGSVDSDGFIASYSWSFGDGGTSVSANPTHGYSSAGTYAASLTVTDDDGASDSDSVSVTVSTTTPPPPPPEGMITVHEVTRTSGYQSPLFGFIPTRQSRYILDIQCTSATIGIGGVSFSLGSGRHTVVVDSDASQQKAWVSINGGAFSERTYLYPKYNNEGLSFTPYSATFSGSGITVYSIKQQIESKGLVTAFGSNKYQGIGYDGPHGPSYTRDSMEDIRNAGMTATIFGDIDSQYVPSQLSYLQDRVNEGWDAAIHFSFYNGNTWNWESAKQRRAHGRY
jgi:PKD repeat protein